MYPDGRKLHMDAGPERPVAPPVEPPPPGGGGSRAVTLAIAVVAVAGLFACAIVFLVLTGIIAEPVTVLERLLGACPT